MLNFENAFIQRIHNSSYYLLKFLFTRSSFLFSMFYNNVWEVWWFLYSYWISKNFWSQNLRWAIVNCSTIILTLSHCHLLIILSPLQDVWYEPHLMNSINWNMPVVLWTYSASGLGLTIQDVIWFSEWQLFQSNAAIRPEIWDLQLGPEMWELQRFIEVRSWKMKQWKISLFE